MTSSSTQSDKDLMAEMLRAALPACQPQEGSPPNTFTTAEVEELQAVFPEMNIASKHQQHATENKHIKEGFIDICDWNNTVDLPQQEKNKATLEMQQPPQDDSVATTVLHEKNAQDEPQGQDGSTVSEDLSLSSSSSSSSWHGAPRMPTNPPTRAFRQQVREGRFTGPTNGVCPGFLQCNLVVLPQGQLAFDFLLFCQRNKKACPLIEVCDVGSPFPNGVARGADLRTDIPKYAIYRNGKLDKEVTDVTDYWPKDSVAFLIGCSFSYDGALLDANIPLKSADQGKNVPMYKTSLKCRSAGSLSGTVVVSMKPIKALDIAKEVEITSKFPHAHGGPVCVGSGAAIGIDDLDKPDWGDAIDVAPDEVPVFHACGVTPQSVLMDSKVPFAITHSAGYMFVTDMPSDAVF